MKIDYTHLEWDSAAFGFNVARIISPVLSERELSSTLKHLRDAHYRMVYWNIPTEHIEMTNIAKALGGFWADEKVTYKKEINDLVCVPSTSAYIAVPYSAEEADTAMIDLALQSAEYSRFRFDPSFPDELCDKLYTSWIKRSVRHEIAWNILVVKEKNLLQGLITLGSKNDRGDIGLVAVAEGARGKGIGRVLVNAANIHFSARGYTVTQVVTQKRNLGACNLYESCGYQVEKIENVFHFWL
jgi:dTDP-4-amino-4,6-dideoxy-D-galactose acyltransferase